MSSSSTSLVINHSLDYLLIYCQLQQAATFLKQPEHRVKIKKFACDPCAYLIGPRIRDGNRTMNETGGQASMAPVL